MAEWDAGRGYLNFEENAAGSRSFYDEVTHRHLRRIKTQVDPGDIFCSNHPIARRPGSRAAAVSGGLRSQSVSFSAASPTFSLALATLGAGVLEEAAEALVVVIGGVLGLVRGGSPGRRGGCTRRS